MFLDVDDTIIEVHGYQKQGSGYGHAGVRGINAILATATATTATPAPIIIGQQLGRGRCGSPRGTKRFVRDGLVTLRRLHDMRNVRVLVRADSAFYGHATVAAAIDAGGDVSVTARMDSAIKRAIATIADDAWEVIEHTDAIFDEGTNRWTSTAEVVEAPFTAFTSRKKNERIIGRLVVRRIPELNKKNLDQPILFDTQRFPAFFTITTLNKVTADKAHRGHAIIEHINAT